MGYNKRLELIKWLFRWTVVEPINFIIKKIKQ